MNKIETVAPMAATIFGSAARQELQPVQEGLAHSIAAQAWALL